MVCYQCGENELRDKKVALGEKAKTEMWICSNCNGVYVKRAEVVEDAL